MPSSESDGMQSSPVSESDSKSSWVPSDDASEPLETRTLQADTLVSAQTSVCTPHPLTSDPLDDEPLDHNEESQSDAATLVLHKQRLHYHRNRPAAVQKKPPKHEKWLKELSLFTEAKMQLTKCCASECSKVVNYNFLIRRCKDTFPLSISARRQFLRSLLYPLQQFTVSTGDQSVTSS